MGRRDAKKGAVMRGRVLGWKGREGRKEEGKDGEEGGEFAAHTFHFSSTISSLGGNVGGAS